MPRRKGPALKPRRQLGRGGGGALRAAFFSSSVITKISLMDVPGGKNPEIYALGGCPRLQSEQKRQLVEQLR